MNSWQYEYYLWYVLSPLASTLVYLSAAIGIATIVASWRIYAKAGEHGWAALIPFYAQYVLYRISWGNGWMFLLLLVPFVNIVIAIVTLVKLSKSFGHGGGFACGLIFLNCIFMIILGFDGSRYLGPGGQDAQRRGEDGYSGGDGYRGNYDGRYTHTGDFDEEYRRTGGYSSYERRDDYEPNSGGSYGGGRSSGENYGSGYDYGYSRPEVTRCPDCGASISGSAKFCPYCGGKLR